MKKHKPEKILFDFYEIRKSIDFLEKNKIPYNLTLSNYTTQIECDYYNRQYLAKKQSLKVFAAFNKIKNDLINWSANEPPIIDPAELRFFDHNLPAGHAYSHIYCTDIKSAYATVLKNDYFIQESTFEYINSLKKDERLACVGMLAAKKEHFEFNGEELNYTGTTKSDFTPYFQYCIMRTAQIMDTLKHRTRKSTWLFYWVDCIYYSNDNRGDIEEALNELGYQYKSEILYHLAVKEHPKHFNVEYYKSKNAILNKLNKPKTLNFPKPQTIRENLANYFLEKSKFGTNIEPN